MLTYKMIAMDLDDTLLNDEWRINPRDKEAIFRAKEAGVLVLLATGRMYGAALPYAMELNLETPLIVYQGALIIKHHTEEILFHHPIPMEQAVAVLETVKPYGYHINLYRKNELIIAHETPESLRYEAMSGCKATVVGDLSCYVKENSFDPIKILVAAKEEQLDALIPKLQQQFGAQLHIAKSKPYFLEFSHPLANKGHALATMAHYYGIDREEIIAVGDGFNDIEMLSYAGLGAVVDNARDSIKAVADYITASNNQGGIAQVIQTFIFHDNGENK